MHKASWLILSVAVSIYLAYLGYLRLLPSIQIDNLTSKTLSLAKVQLPSNQLDMSPIAPGQSQEIYYSPQQKDGVYRYIFEFSDGTQITGSCGYITQSEYTKRVLISIRSATDIKCYESALGVS